MYVCDCTIWGLCPQLLLTAQHKIINLKFKYSNKTNTSELLLEHSRNVL